MTESKIPEKCVPLKRKDRIYLAVAYYGWYTFGMAATDSQRIDEDCAMDNGGVPYYEHQLNDKQREILVKYNTPLTPEQIAKSDELFADYKATLPPKKELPYTVEGVPFHVADVPNLNGRIYPTAVLEAAIRKFENKETPLFGELGFPRFPPFEVQRFSEINLNRVSHLIKNIRMEKNILMGDVEILDNPMGAILAGSMPVDFRIRCYADINKDGVVNKCHIITFDATSNGA